LSLGQSKPQTVIPALLSIDLDCFYAAVYTLSFMFPITEYLTVTFETD